MSEVLEPLAQKFGDTPSIPIGCNRLQSVATDREVWCGNGISTVAKVEQYLLWVSSTKHPVHNSYSKILQVCLCEGNIILHIETFLCVKVHQ